jgi:hypothetical protein
MVRGGVDGIYRCKKIVKVLGEREQDSTHRPFCLEANVASKERSRDVFGKGTLNLSMGDGYSQVGVTAGLSRSARARID